jgi:hypothetical protein
MDRHAIVLFIPVLAIFFTGLVVFSFTSLGRALAKRLERGGSDMEDRLARLEAENERLYQGLVDAHHRLDAAERVLPREAMPRGHVER